jgi:superoxide oxidase
MHTDQHTASVEIEVENERYNKITIGLHWFMLLLLIAVYATIELRGIFPKGSAERMAMKTWHFMLGLSVLVLVIIRLFVRLRTTRPYIVPEPSRVQQLLARCMHFSLYALMICMPIAGWLILSGEGISVPFWGLELPPLMGENEALAKLIEEVHVTAGKVGYFLIGLHALAGLYHHYFVKDNTLKRILP